MDNTEVLTRHRRAHNNGQVGSDRPSLVGDSHQPGTDTGSRVNNHPSQEDNR